MWISNFAIKRPVVTIVTMLALVVFGVFALLKLNTDEFPEINPPIVVVSVPYPGAAPGTVEREVVDPLEEAFTGLSGIDQVTSTSYDSYALMIVQFKFGTDIQQAEQDIRDKISEKRIDLPQEMKEPILSRWDPDQLPIVSLALTSKTLSQAELTRLADPAIKDELSAVNGVANVTVSGGVERQLVVELNPQALEANGVGVNEVVQALQAQNLAAPVGNLKAARTQISIRLEGRLKSPAEFAQLSVAQRNGHIVRLGDVATVKDATEEPTTAALYNGAPSVGIDVIKSRGFSTTAVAKDVLRRVDELQKTLPQGAELQVVRNSGVRVHNSVLNVEETLIEGALLTILVVFLFLNSWRSTVITGLALPVSVITSFVAVYAAGFTLNTMSLLGLSLAIGILIDDAIVVRENIVRHVEMGKDHFTAAKEGTAEIGLAVAATTFSIVAVFVPIGFMSGMAGQWFRPFALTIAFSVLVSLFVSFSLDPMLSAYWSDPHKADHEKAWITRKLDGFNHWFNAQTGRYKRVIAWALDHRWSMVGLTTLSFVLAVALPASGLVGSEFFPSDDRSEVSMVVDTPPGSSLEYTQRKVNEMTRLIRAHPEVEYVYATIGGQTGEVDEADLYIRLVPKDQRTTSQEELGAQLRREAQTVAGATAWVSNGGIGGAQKQIQVQLHGPDVEVLNRLAVELQHKVEKVPGAVDVGLSTRGQRPEVAVELNRGLAGSLGITAGQVAQSLRPAFAGVDAGDWVDPSGQTRDVEVRFAPGARYNVSDLQQVPLIINGLNGPVTMPLGQIAEFRSGLAPAQISHLDRDRVINVEANTEGRPLSAVNRGIQAQLATMHFPAGYGVSQGGQTKDQAEVFASFLGSLGIAVMLMYLILVIQFGSFLDPLAIMLSLPLSLIGVMIALLLSGSTINIMTLIGVILLMGIVAKNAILLIDFAKWSHEEGLPLREALIEAGGVRLRPILMTTFALVIGMLPVALGTGEGAESRAPMGIAVIGGVITSTLLTLLVIPTFYEILSEWREWLFGLFRGEVREREREPGPIIGREPTPEAGD
ncbi:MAG TPA: efflux RND transporter permease subunit [Longimicrobiaceae bacterium]|nr:efflux RND transporter permease subunit [Longimicrobiaceae bacterium]